MRRVSSRAGIGIVAKPRGAPERDSRTLGTSPGWSPSAWTAPSAFASATPPRSPDADPPQMTPAAAAVLLQQKKRPQDPRLPDLKGQILF